MRAPEFWRREAGLARLLAPLACLYDAGRRLSWAAKRPRHAALPVICAGNFVAGGAGKTPHTFPTLAFQRIV